MTPPGPSRLLAELPRALGRRPVTGETIAFGWADNNPAHAVAIAIHPNAWPHEQVAAVHQLVTDGADACVLVAYTGPGGQPEPTLRWLVAAAVTYGLRTADALTVTRDRAGATWRSLDCTDPGCCPPEGTPLTEGDPTP